jgi:hypothetical protein
VGRTAIDLIELGVGLGCLALAVAAWRAGTVAFRVGAAVLALAGAAAVAHAAVSLAR